jgi:hypothetical protein
MLLLPVSAGDAALAVCDLHNHHKHTIPYQIYSCPFLWEMLRLFAVTCVHRHILTASTSHQNTLYWRQAGSQAGALKAGAKSYNSDSNSKAS